MIDRRSPFHAIVRRTCAIASALALLGCAAAPERADLSPGPRWIAILAFAPETPAAAGEPDPASRSFARAVSLTLRDELAALPRLMVVMPAGAAPGPPAAEPPELPPQIEWIVGGRVGQENGQIRFDITLHHRTDAGMSWQQRFVAAPDAQDASRWRREIPAALARRVGAPTPPTAGLGLGACRSEPAAGTTLRAIDAYGSYRTRDDLLRVRAELEQALRDEPGCTEAQAHRAMTHVSELANRWSPDAKADLALADRLSREVAAANPTQPYARLARLQVLRMQGQVAAAVQEATALTALDPSNGLFVGRLAALQFDAGDAAATLTAARRMQGLPNGTLAARQQGLLFEALALYSLGEEDAAVPPLRRLLDLNPSNGLAWQVLAGISALQGRQAEADAALRRFLALTPPGQSITRLRAGETTVTDSAFLRQRERYYEGLRRAGLPP